MRAKLLLEAFNIRTENNFKYADFDVESLYKFRPETMGSITFDEVEASKKDFDKRLYNIAHVLSL